jgi:hypothetical protein
MRWALRGGVALVLVIGWLFIAWRNHFHVSAPLVFVCLGYLAVVSTIYNLWRTGASAVAVTDDEADSTWAKPAGALGELEREKRTLLKAIKEAEFDLQMGKLSQRDADAMVQTYRARAIEVIKGIDRLTLGAAESAREQILREVRARIELDGKGARRAEARPDAAAQAANGARTPHPQAAGGAPPIESVAAGEPVAAAVADASVGASAGAALAIDATPSPQVDSAADPGRDPIEAARAAAARAAAIQAAVEEHDASLNADSTTISEPRRDAPAKEATR